MLPNILSLICIGYSPVILHIQLSSLVIVRGNLRIDKGAGEPSANIAVASEAWGLCGRDGNLLWFQGQGLVGKPRTPGPRRNTFSGYYRSTRLHCGVLLAAI